MPRRGNRAGAGIAAMLTALGLAVAGCDSHSKPTVASEPPQTPASVTSASSSPSPSAAPSGLSSLSAGGKSPGLPTSSPIVGVSALTSAYPSAAAQEPAAIDVVKQFFDAINYETDTGDTSRASALFTPKCAKCAQDVAAIKQSLDSGHTIRGGHVHLVSVDSAYPSYTQVVTVTATITQDAADELDSHGQVVKHYDAAGHTRMIFDLETDLPAPRIWQLDVLSQ